MQILTSEGWKFEALEAGFSSVSYYKLWDHILYYPCKQADIETDRVLTGFLNTSCPPGHSDYEDAQGWGYTPDEQILLEIYYDDDARMSHKRVFYFFELQNNLVTKVHFFLRWSDAGFDEAVHETRASRGTGDNFMDKLASDPAIARTLGSLSRDPYGHDLAERVWQRLVALGGLYRKHRDYCGIGLVYDPTTGVAALVVVYDADPVSTLLEFGTKEAFVDFLAQQSDFTMAGTDDGPPELRADAPQYVNNQRLDRGFLIGLID